LCGAARHDRLIAATSCYTIACRPTAPAFADETPQRIAVVELDEGPRLTTTLVNVAPDAVRIGMKLRPFFDDQAQQDVTLLRYRRVRNPFHNRQRRPGPSLAAADRPRPLPPWVRDGPPRAVRHRSPWFGYETSPTVAEIWRRPLRQERRDPPQSAALAVAAAPPSW